MNRILLNTLNVKFAKKANGIIYCLQKLPWLGKKIPDKLYEGTKMKIVLGWIGELMAIVGKFIGKGFYLGVIVALPAYFINKDMFQSNFLQIFFFLSLIMGTVLYSSEVFAKETVDFHMVKLMRCDAKEYYKFKITYEKLSDFIFFIPGFLIVGNIAGIRALECFALIIEFTTLRFIAEAIYLKIYDKFHNVPTSKTAFLVIGTIAGMALAYGLPFLNVNMDLKPVVFNWGVVGILIAFSIYSIVYILKYDKYKNISGKILGQELVVNEDEFSKDINFSDVKLDDKKITKEELNSKVYDNKEGYEYLNALFFLRHRRIIVKPMEIRVIIIGVLFLIGVALIIFMPEKKEELVNALKGSGALMVFVMYILATGERICKAMFYNCDVSLLRYGYYRERKVILSNFTARLKRVVIVNLIPAVELCVAFIILVAASGYGQDLVAMIPLFLCILCLACFFSIHHLFMYYILQPYTVEFQIKSPLFSLVNFVIYIIGYGCLKIKNVSYYFTFVVVAITAIYMAIALSVTYKKAPKTFRLK